MSSNNLFRVSEPILLEGIEPEDFMDVMIGEIFNPGHFYLQVKTSS